MSQAELAHRSRMHALTVTRLEGGRTHRAVNAHRAYAAALDVARGDLASPEEAARRQLRGAS